MTEALLCARRRTDVGHSTQVIDMTAQVEKHSIINVMRCVMSTAMTIRFLEAISSFWRQARPGGKTEFRRVAPTIPVYTNGKNCGGWKIGGVEHLAVRRLYGFAWREWVIRVLEGSC